MFSFIKKIRNSLSVPEKLREATSLVVDSLTQAGYPERVQDTYDNIEYNECGLALENLCENLYEFSCPVPQKAFDLLKESGIIMGVDSKYWEMLKPQVTE